MILIIIEVKEIIEIEEENPVLVLHHAAEIVGEKEALAQKAID